MTPTINYITNCLFYSPTDFEIKIPGFDYAFLNSKEVNVSVYVTLLKCYRAARIVI